MIVFLYVNWFDLFLVRRTFTSCSETHSSVLFLISPKVTTKLALCLVVGRFMKRAPGVFKPNSIYRLCIAVMYSSLNRHICYPSVRFALYHLSLGGFRQCLHGVL